MEDQIIGFLIKGIAIPIIIVIFSALIFQFLINHNTADSCVGASIGISVLVGYFLLFGWPDMPPRGFSQKIPIIIILSGIIGLWFDYKMPSFLQKNRLNFIWPILIIGWLGWRQVINPSADYSYLLFVLLFVSIFILNCTIKYKDRSCFSPILFMLASTGASFITLIGSSGVLSQQFAILAAACGGFLLCNWPRERFKFSNSAIFAIGGAFISLSTSSILFSEVYLPAFGLLVIVFITPTLVLKIPRSDSAVFGPLIMVIIGIIPVSLATILAIFITGDEFKLPI